MAVRAEHRSNLQPFNDNGDVFKRGKNSRVGRKKTTNYLFLCVIFVFLLQHIWPILLQKHTRDDMPFRCLFGSLSRTPHVSNVLKQPPDKQFAEQFCFSFQHQWLGQCHNIKLFSKVQKQLDRYMWIMGSQCCELSINNRIAISVRTFMDVSSRFRQMNPDHKGKTGR